MAPNDNQARAEGDLQTAIDRVEQQLGEIDGACQQLADAINSALRTAAFISPLGVWLFSKKVSSVAGELFKEIEELKKACKEFLDAGIPVFSLIRVGFGWSNAVLPDLSGMVSTARDIKPNALHAWEGPAAKAYFEKRWGQRDALQGTTNIVKDTGQWLVDLAALNAKFLIDLVDPLIELAEAIIEIAAELATVLGILEAIDTAADAVASTITAVLRIAQDAAKHVADSIQALNEARVILNNNDVFPNKGWPQAVNR